MFNKATNEGFKDRILLFGFCEMEVKKKEGCRRPPSLTLGFHRIGMTLWGKERLRSKVNPAPTITTQVTCIGPVPLYLHVCDSARIQRRTCMHLPTDSQPRPDWMEPTTSAIYEARRQSPNLHSQFGDESPVLLPGLQLRSKVIACYRRYPFAE